VRASSDAPENEGIKENGKVFLVFLRRMKWLSFDSLAVLSAQAMRFHVGLEEENRDNRNVWP
jgi:hypothetical protein